MTWSFSIGNLAQRAANAPAASSPSVSDTLLPISDLATGYPDEEGSFEWRADGNYVAIINTNLLANTSTRVDATTGYRDLLLDYAGSGSNPNPPNWGTYAGRTALRAYRPLFQDIEAMPGEDMALAMGIYLPANSVATAVQVRVTNTTSGLSWSGANTAWESGGVVESQATDDTWEDFTETIVADVNMVFRSTYRVIVEPVANTYAANTCVYVSGLSGTGVPALYAEADFVALIGHNLPETATVSVGNFAFSVIDTPTASTTGNTELTQSYTMSIQMPAGNQPKPKIGEVWIGKLITLTRGIDPDIDIKEGDVAQIRVQGATGRQEVVSDIRLPATYATMKVRTFTDAQWIQYRNLIYRGTRFGADPFVLVPPDDLQGSGRVMHGRIGPILGTIHKENTWREFSMEFAESTFSAN
jgi:hypothetical protein